MANYHGPLKAVDCHIDSERYDIVRVVLAAGGHPYNWAYQVTYEVVSSDAYTNKNSLSRVKDASILSWVARS